MKIDFSAFSQPTFDITFRDDAHTTLHVLLPTRGELKALQARFKAIKSGKEGSDPFDEMVALAVRIISKNTERRTVTIEEVTGPLKLNDFELIGIVTKYFAFISEVTLEKN